MSRTETQTVAQHLAGHGFTFTGMGGNLSAYTRPIPDVLAEHRIYSAECDATTAPTRQSERVILSRVDLTLEAEGHSDLRAYHDLYTGSLRTLLAKMDRAQDARMLGALSAKLNEEGGIL